jgi:hypothetical protein
MPELFFSNFSQRTDQSISAAHNQNKEPRIMVDTIFCLISLGITAITTSAIFLYVGFLFLVPPREDMLATKPRLPAATPTASAPAILLREGTLPSTNDTPPVATPNDLFAVYSQWAKDKEVSYEQYRARMQYLQKQQAEIELRLTDRNLSTAERSRLERQKAYWGRAIHQMLILP